MIRRLTREPAQILAQLPPELARRLIIVGVLLAAAWVGFGDAPVRLMILAVGGLIGLAVAVERPNWRLPGLVAAAAFVPFSVGTGTESSINGVMLVVAGLFGLRMMEMALDGRARLPESPMNTPWLWMLLVSLLSLVAGEALRSPWLVTKSNFLLVQFAQFSLFLLSAFAFWLVAGDPGGAAQVRRIVSMLLGLGALLLLILVVPRLAPLFAGRLLIGQPVFRLCVVALAASVAFFAADQPRWVRRFAGLLALGMVIVPIWRLSGWTSGWLPGLVALTTVFALYLLHRRMQPALVLMTLLGLIGAVYLVGTLAAVEAWSLNTRFMAWRAMGQLMDGHWLLGLGLASYGHYWNAIFGVAQYLDPSTGYLHYTFTPQVNMHNNFIDIVAQMGILGLVTFAWLLTALGLHAWRAFRAGRGELSLVLAATNLSLLVGILVVGNLGDWLIPFVYNIGLAGFRDSVFAWIVLGLLVLAQRAEGEQGSEGTSSSNGA